MLADTGYKVVGEADRRQLVAIGTRIMLLPKFSSFRVCTSKVLFKCFTMTARLVFILWLQHIPGQKVRELAICDFIKHL